MIFHATDIHGAWLVEPEPRQDARGSFTRAFCLREFTGQGLGFEVVPLKLGALTAFFGAIRCTTNHLGKRQNEGYHDETAPPVPVPDVQERARKASFDRMTD